MIKDIARKIAPSLYLSLAHLNVELWDASKEVKQFAVSKKVVLVC